VYGPGHEVRKQENNKTNSAAILTERLTVASNHQTAWFSEVCGAQTSFHFPADSFRSKLLESERRIERCGDATRAPTQCRSGRGAAKPAPN